jgi:hypothetical protein
LDFLIVRFASLAIDKYDDGEGGHALLILGKNKFYLFFLISIVLLPSKEESFVRSLMSLWWIHEPSSLSCLPTNQTPPFFKIQKENDLIEVYRRSNKRHSILQ